MKGCVCCNFATRKITYQSQPPKGAVELMLTLNALKSKEILDYWYGTGTPTHLIKSLRAMDIPVMALEGYQTAGSALLNGNVTGEDPIPVLYYSGYLTIKSYNQESGLYTLGFPNKEVRNGFLNNVLSVIGKIPNHSSDMLTLSLPEPTLLIHGV